MLAKSCLLKNCVYIWFAIGEFRLVGKWFMGLTLWTKQASYQVWGMKTVSENIVSKIVCTFVWSHLRLSRNVTIYCSYQNSKNLCENLAGTMSMSPYSQHTIGHPDKCAAIKWDLWVPIVQGGPKEGEDGQFSWHDDRQGFNSSLITDTKWYPGQPNGLHFQPCVAVSSRQAGDPKLWCDLSL